MNETPNLSDANAVEPIPTNGSITTSALTDAMQSDTHFRKFSWKSRWMWSLFFIPNSFIRNEPSVTTVS